MARRFATDIEWPHRTDLPRTARSLREYRNPTATIRCNGGSGGRGTGTLLAVLISEKDPAIADLVGEEVSGGLLVTPHDVARLDRGGVTGVWCPTCRVEHRASIDRAREVAVRLRAAGAPPGGWPYRLDVEAVVVPPL